MTLVLDMFVRGEPVGQPRQRFRAIPTDRFRRFKNGRSERVYMAQAYHDPDANKDCDIWKSKIRAAVRASLSMRDPVEVPVRADLFFYMPRPKYLLEAKAPVSEIPFDQKPDIDNLAKAVLDALTTVWQIGDHQVGIWDDDKRVTDSQFKKQYIARGNNPGVWITVETLADPEPELFESKFEPKKEKPVHPASLLPAGIENGSVRGVPGRPLAVCIGPPSSLR